jgi:hypothetical protein
MNEHERSTEMDQIDGHPTWTLHLNKHGRLTAVDGCTDPDPAAGLTHEVAAQDLTDLFVFAHGWQESVTGARELFRDMFALIAAAADRALPGRRVGFAGVIWPSLKFPTTSPSTSTPDAVHTAAFIPSGAHVAQALAPDVDPNQQSTLNRLATLADDQPADAESLEEFHRLLPKLVTPEVAVPDEDAGEQQVLTGSAHDVFRRLAAFARAVTSGRTVEQELAKLPVYRDLWHGAIMCWRVASFFEMKARAGTVGLEGLGPLVGQLGQACPQLRIHLAGHSFGARLVSYSLSGLTPPTGTATPIKSLSLIQGAFSHCAFAEDRPWGGPGGLAGMKERVDGPLIATFSTADRALRIWYPMASVASHDVTGAVEAGATRWEAMGAKGFWHPSDTVPTALGASGDPYPFVPKDFYSLNASTVIKDGKDLFAGAHSDIKHEEVAWAIACAAATGLRSEARPT